MKSLLAGAVALTSVVAVAPALAQQPLSIVFTHHSSASNVFWQAVKKGFDDACQKVNAQCQMVFTQTEGSVEQQAANMQAALARSPTALLTTIVDNKAFDGIIAEARSKGVIVIGVNVDDTDGASGNARQAFVGQGFIPAGQNLGKALSQQFPKDGPINVLVGVSAPGQNWSEQRAAGVIKFLEEYKAGNPGREVAWKRIDSGTDFAITADRVGAYLNANPNTNVYFDTGFWVASVARVLKDRGVPPGKIAMGGFDLVPDVLQQMKGGYIQALVDQQPYMQGFLPVMEVYLAKTTGLAPANVDTGQGVVQQKDVEAVIELSRKGVR